MFTRLAIVFAAVTVAFAAPAMAGEATKTMSFTQPKTMSKSWLTEGLWLDNSNGADCGAYAKTFNKMLSEAKATEDDKKTSASYTLTVDGTSYEQGPENEMGSCTVINKLPTVNNQTTTVVRCTGEGEVWLLGQTVIKTSERQVVLITIPFNADNTRIDPTSTSARVLNYCGKIKLTPVP